MIRFRGGLRARRSSTCAINRTKTKNCGNKRYPQRNKEQEHGGNKKITKILLSKNTRCGDKVCSLQTHTEHRGNLKKYCKFCYIKSPRSAFDKTSIDKTASMKQHAINCSDPFYFFCTLLIY